MKKLFFIIFSLTIIGTASSQNVGINGTGATPNASAMLDVVAANKGILIPRVALTTINSNAPIGASVTTSLLVYNTVTAGVSPNNVLPGFYYWNGTIWVRFINSKEAWETLGNAGTNAATNFLGTTDNNALAFRVNDVIKARLETNGTISTLNTGESVFIGEDAGANDDLVANENVFVGHKSGTTNTSGRQNTNVGAFTLETNTTGSFNTSLGRSTLNKNTSGGFNTAIGFETLQKSTTANENTMLGARAGQQITTGSNNTVMGRSALSLNVGGHRNIAIGYQAANNITSGSNNLIIGYDIDAPIATSSNQMSIGNLIYGTGINGTGTTVSTGKIGIGTASPGSKLEIYQLGTTSVLTLLTLNSFGNSGAGRGERILFKTPDAGLTSHDGGAIEVAGLGGGKNTYMAFSTSSQASGFSEKVRIDNFGKVGIGTTGPQELLHIDGGNAIIVGANGNIADVGSADVLAVVDATKWPINAYATGTNAGAGFFKISNAGNTKPAIDIKNAGIGEGILSTSTGTGIPIRGLTNTAFTTGLFTNNNNGNNINVIDVQHNGTGTSGNTAVRGTANSAGAGNGTGVIGDGGFAGIRGFGGTYAGLFSGNVRVVGNLTVTGVKAFKIDHPLDPENKYLYHSCVESPDMMNVYNGNTKTNSNGIAIVQLPDYFEALNMDYRYQLTVIGQFAQVIVLKKVKSNQFVIQSDIPNVEVSWQVTGVRNDPRAKETRMVVEVEKNAKDKGKYLDPKAYGLPENRSVDYEDNIRARKKYSLAKGKED